MPSLNSVFWALLGEDTKLLQTKSSKQFSCDSMGFVRKK